MTAKQHGLKKNIVRLSDDERVELNALVDKGKRPARKLLKARILLKADASALGQGGLTPKSPRRPGLRR